MNHAALFNRLQMYGADMTGIQDRFMGDTDLYGRCYVALLNEPNFSALDAAMLEGDYKAAFEAAHAMKGLSGNLGLTPLYDALCALILSFRTESYDTVQEEYQEIKHQLQQLTSFLSENEIYK